GRKRFLLTRGLLLVAAASGGAALPTDAAKKAAAIGQPMALAAQPSSITLHGPRAMQQITITGRYADGTLRDLTPFCEWTVEPGDVAGVSPSGFVLPKKSGGTGLVARAGGQTIPVAVTVKDFEKPKPLSFRHDMIAALNVGGCNAGACHGTPSGKNGFKLSLRGYDPPADYVQLTRDMLGRRTDRLDPEASLIRQKSL